MFKSRSQSISGPSSSPGITLMEGVLEKKKIFGSSKVHCTLREGKLWYCEDKGRENLIDVSHAQSIREGKAKFSFEIITSSRTHVLIADSQASRDKWITCLREAMRVSSRKMSAQSYLEGDEDSMSSIVKPPTINALKPGVPSTLPASLVTRMPMKSSGIEEIRDPKNSSVQKSDTMVNSQNYDSVKDELKTEHLSAVPENCETVEERRDEKISTEITKDFVSEIMVELKSLNDDDGTKSESLHDYESVTSSDNHFQANQFALVSHDVGESIKYDSVLMEEEKDGVVSRSVPNEIVDHTSSSLYANSMDIKKFLSEQRLEREVSVEERRCIRSENSMQSESWNVDSSEIETKTDITESTDVKNCEFADEELDEVLPLIGDNQKIVESTPAPVMHRRSQSRSRSSNDESFQMDVTPELVEVELDVDFVSTAIPDLPHPHLESKWSSAFVNIRSMLSNTSKVDSFRFSVEPGCAVESLKCFLNSLECI